MLRIAEKKNLKTLKVKDHINLIKNLTYTSHVSYFGDESILNMKLKEFFGGDISEDHLSNPEDDEYEEARNL